MAEREQERREEETEAQPPPREGGRRRGGRSRGAPAPELRAALFGGPHPGKLSMVTFGESAADPAELTEYLWLGSQGAAMDKEELQRKKITHIANVADDVDCFHSDGFKYLHCEVVDGGEDGSIVEVFQQVTDFVRGARGEGGRVLLHCAMGINRSATVAMAVLMNLEGWTLKEAHEHTVQRRSVVSPFPGNRKFIAKWELETRGQSSKEEWLPQRDEDLKRPPTFFRLTRPAEANGHELHQAGACTEERPLVYLGVWSLPSPPDVQ